MRQTSVNSREINDMTRKQDKPNTRAQAEAYAQGQAAFVRGISVTDNPHLTDVAFIWWHRGWKDAQAESLPPDTPCCPWCNRAIVTHPSMAEKPGETQ